MWKNPYSALVDTQASSTYSWYVRAGAWDDAEDGRDGCGLSLPFISVVVEETYSTLPTKPCRVTSAYATAGQADTSLHTMAVLQVYQADLLRILDHGKGLRPDKVQELCQNLTGIKEKDKAFSSTLQFHLLVCSVTQLTPSSTDIRRPNDSQQHSRR